MGLALKWAYINRTVNLSMPNYIPAALHKLQHKASNRPHYPLHRWARPKYGQSTQHANPEDNSPLLPVKKISSVQKKFSTFLYYRIFSESAIIVSLGNMAPTRDKASEQTHEYLVWIINYLASHPIFIVCYKASYTILRIHDDASYLSIRLFPIWAGGNHYLSENSDGPPNNGSINTICKFMGNVMGSAAEGEIVFIYIND